MNEAERAPGDDKTQTNKLKIHLETLKVKATKPDRARAGSKNKREVLRAAAYHALPVLVGVPDPCGVDVSEGLSLDRSSTGVRFAVDRRGCAGSPTARRKRGTGRRPSVGCCRPCALVGDCVGDWVGD